MTPEFRDEMLRRLRDPETHQTEGKFCIEGPVTGTCFCFVGLALDVAKVPYHLNTAFRRVYESSRSGIMSPDMWNAVQMHPGPNNYGVEVKVPEDIKAKYIPDWEHDFASLMELNDMGVPFPVLADLFEANWKTL